MYSDYPAYRWAFNEEVPWTPLTKPLAQCKVALASSGGVYCKGQQRFHTKDDTSYREISKHTAMDELRIAHFGYRTEDAKTDPNCVFPLERLRELEAEGVIGELADPAYGFMGGVYSARKVGEDLAPSLVECVLKAGVDLFFLVPA